MLDLTSVQNEIEHAGYTIHTIGRSRLASLVGCSKDQARRMLDKMRISGFKKLSNVDSPWINQIPKSVKTETVTETADSLSYELPRTRIQSLDELIKQFQVDTEKWSVKSWTANKWEVGAKDADGKIVIEPLYQVKAIFEKKKIDTVEFVKSEIERLKTEAKSTISVFNIGKAKKYNPGDGLMAEIAIVDHHFGSLAWKMETGQANYDHKIASVLYEDAFTDLLQRCANGNKLEKILIIHGNDQSNTNGGSGATANGTPQTDDARWQKVFRAQWECSVKAINTALEIAPVHIIAMGGNHDRDNVWHSAFSLECFYSGNKNVTIDNDPIVRKYFKYGHNLIGFCHGDTVKMTDLPLIMAAEVPELYGSAKRTEWHTGHLHHNKTSEHCGTRVRTLPSLSAPNAWAISHGYTRSTRASQAFLWSKTRGLLDIKEHSIDFDSEG